MIDSFRPFDSFDYCNNINDFLILYYLYSVCLHCTYLYVTFRHRRRTLDGTRVSHGRSNICSFVIAPLFLSLPVTLFSFILSERVSLLSVNYSRIQMYNGTYVSRMELSLAARLPSAGSTVYAQRGSRFRSRWQVSGLHDERNSSHRENGTERRDSHRATQLRTGQSTSEFTVVFILASRCRVLPFHGPPSVNAQTALVDCSHSRVIRISLRLGALPLESARLFPRASLFDCSHVR